MFSLTFAANAILIAFVAVVMTATYVLAFGGQSQVSWWRKLILMAVNTVVAVLATTALAYQFNLPGGFDLDTGRAVTLALVAGFTLLGVAIFWGCVAYARLQSLPRRGLPRPTKKVAPKAADLPTAPAVRPMASARGV